MRVAHHIQKFYELTDKFNFLKQGDIEESMQATKAIGGDRIRSHSHGHVQPDLFTHGTSEQRQRWFMRGFKSGNLSDGDTFSIPYEQL